MPFRKVKLESFKEEHMADYKHPEVLVATEWVAQHLNDPKIRLVEGSGQG
jgi:hypothetical protein